MPLAAPSAHLARSRGVLGALLLCALAACRAPAGPPSAPEAAEVPEPSSVPPSPAPPAPEVEGRQDPAPPPRGDPAPAAAPATPEEAARLEAEAALAAGDFEAAREALDALVTRPRLDAARVALLEGRLEEALAETQAALEQAPSHGPSLLLEGSLLVALADRRGEIQLLPEALEKLLLAGDCRPALERGARVALRLERTDTALELARRAAVREPDPSWDEAEALAAIAWPGREPERTLVEASLALWRQRGGTAAPEASGLFDEAEDALSLLVSRHPGDRWVWLTLGEAYLEAARAAEARAAAERGLERLPDEEALYDLLARAARAEDGPRGVLRAFDRQQERRPREGLAWWYPALEQFRLGLEGGPQAERSFARGESAFRACRVRRPELEPACLRYETLARTGQGWAWLAADDLVRAEREFRAAAEPLPDGLQLVVEGRLAPAAEGLQRVLEQRLMREELGRAADLAAFLLEHVPGDVRLARQAATLQRELGNRLQLEAEDFDRAYKERLDDEQRLEELRAQIGILRPGDDLRGTGRELDLFREARRERRRQARRAYEDGLAALRVVAELEPEDLRVRYEAAALAIQRLGAELDWAEQQLLGCIEEGGRRLSDEGLTGEELFTLEEIFGDAHQLMGVLELEHRGRPERARAWFERSIEIGPLPRPEVEEHYIPRCLEAAR
jgi:tetratricopeptide (TPR) repeat protein